jgi:hypothetical protein
MLTVVCSFIYLMYCIVRVICLQWPGDEWVSVLSDLREMRLAGRQARRVREGHRGRGLYASAAEDRKRSCR